MKPRLITLLASIVVFSGCATTSQTQWTPTVDTYGNSRAQYLSRDMEECRSLATRASGSIGEEAVSGAVSGGLVGAAGGAAVGAILSGGSASRGAGTGAVLGAMSGGSQRSTRAESEFRRAFSNCLRSRGHQVIN